jgi:hypothetical protein
MSRKMIPADEILRRVAQGPEIRYGQ